jgi:hypothetical protein
MNLSDRDILAKTIMAEAGNQSQLGMLGVGSVIMNRLRNPGYGNSLQDVILKPGQFSPWNSYTGYAGGAQGQDMMKLQPSQMAYAVADQILDGNYKDPTNGALNFYNPALSSPRWGKSAGGNWMQIGDHLFGTAGSKSTKDKTMSQNSNMPLNASPLLGPMNAGNPQAAAAKANAAMKKPKARGLFDILGNAVGGSFAGLKGALDGSDPDKSDKLAIALMSLSGNPQQLQPLMTMAANDIQERKKLKQGRNGTLEYLQRQAAAGDNAAAAALQLVDSEGPAAAIKAYINSTMGRTGAANKTAASTKQYPNGTTVSVFQDGTKQVRDNQGNLLEGESASEAIKLAQADEIEQARLTEFETKSAAAKAGMVESTVKSIINVDSSLRNYAKAKRALREAINNGQNITGLLTQYFPDISVEAAELTNARNALGLDVVGSVTFGALSKGELDLALTQGLPLGLNEAQLLEYIERRELAMKRYRQSLMEAARVYADPNKDFNDYLDSIKQKEVTNPYSGKSDDELEQLYLEVMSGNSNLSAKKRQYIIDEANRRAEL